MKNFTYYQPSTVAMALPLLDTTWGKTELLGGGTDLHDLQKNYVAQPEKVVSLNGIGGEFKGIEVKYPPKDAPGIITIGAGVKLVEIAEHKEIPAALRMAAGMIAGPQVRNMGTLGGSLCQRNRCWYFRDEHVHCLLKGGRKCFAQEGENQYHAIFTQGHPCVIVHPSTLAPALIAFGANAKIVGPKGERTTAVEKLFQAPVKETQREHTLAPNEILVSVVMQPGPVHSASYEVKHRETNEWPLVQAVVAFYGDAKMARNVRVVLGHVAPTPLVSEAAAKALEGKEVNETTATAAAEAAVEGARPLSQNAYKVQLLKTAVKRAALLAAGVKPYWEG
jgi:xanthine dehydrogenase YagS FAD-binding subunit